jgi:hypothetical protein
VYLEVGRYQLLHFLIRWNSHCSVWNYTRGIGFTQISRNWVRAAAMHMTITIFTSKTKIWDLWVILPSKSRDCWLAFFDLVLCTGRGIWSGYGLYHRKHHRNGFSCRWH